MEEAKEQLACPRCGSTQLSAQKKGYGLIKGLAGGLLVGPLGLAGGFVGSGVKVICMACGHSWRPGEVRPKKPKAPRAPKPSAVDRLNAWTARINAANDKNSPKYQRQVKLAKTIWMVVGPILVLVLMLVWLVPSAPKTDGQQPAPATQQPLDRPAAGR